MTGIVDDYGRFGVTHPVLPRFVVAGQRAVAATLSTDPTVPTAVHKLLASSRQHPNLLVEAIAIRTADR